MKPVFRIVIDDQGDITDLVRDRLLSLSVSDEAGRQSDSAELRLDDRDSAITLPLKGAQMTVSLGYEGGGETVTGNFIVDEFELSGPPAALAIRAKGADMRASLKAPKTRSWDDVSVGGLVGQIAAEHGLEARVGSALRAVRIPHLDQTEESDLHLLARLARDHDAAAKPNGKRLLFVPLGEASSVAGKSMPRVDVRPEHVRRWRATLADRELYSSATAHWHEPATGERHAETAGGGGPAWTLRRTFASAPEAAEAARAKLAELARGTARLSIDLSPGNPVVAAEAELRLAGFRAGIDRSWTCRRVVHKLDRRGYSTTVEGEVKAA